MVAGGGVYAMEGVGIGTLNTRKTRALGLILRCMDRRYRKSITTPPDKAIAGIGAISQMRSDYTCRA
ncbi:hypothetical protein N7526_007801 [Penicillium atrosanguineum]|nr:hypothetical protein N7526_007801 [Penicillium atrosanguineum]